MTFISYAQNYEDVILWRALKHVEQGFYIDVGASDPVDDSVTKAFYDVGWRGINVEPVPAYFSFLREKRPLDTNLQVAVGDHHGTIKIFDVPSIRGWGTASENVAQRYTEKGLQVDEIEVPEVPLTQICKDYVGQREIHFLKIDVEGMESAVLRGMNFAVWRPWIILVEALDPETNKRQAGFESLLLSEGYRKVYYDGLNNFYLAIEHPELEAAFSAPPNVFDEFVKYREIVADERIEKLSKTLEEINQQIQGIQSDRDVIRADRDVIRADRDVIRADRDVIRADRDAIRADRDAIRADRDNFRNALAQVYQSRSWRVTYPLRATTDFARNVKRKTASGLERLFSLPRRLAKHLLQGLLRFSLSRPWIKAPVQKILVWFPHLNTRLKNFALANSNAIYHELRASKIDRNARLASFDGLATVPKDQIYPTPPVIFPSLKGERIIYFYVDHTILCASNTGVQRVARRLGRALLELGEKIVFVKWDASYRQFMLLTQDELLNLSKWHGPVLPPQALNQYPKVSDDALPIERHAFGAGHWLVVPEVPHITFQAQPMTLDVLMEASRLGLKTAFVFYDATPLRQTDLHEMAPRHETYMQQLLLADLVVPISNWSARDLVSFFQLHEGAELTSIPRIVALPLPGESQLTSRVTTPATLNSTGKLILSVGSIVPHKNQVALVHAFERYCEANPETAWQLVLAGNLHPAVASEIKRATLQNSRIRFLDHIADDQLDKLYRSCSFTVFPSIEEGFGLPILESLWYGKPCICANFGSMGEVAEGGGCLTVNTHQIDEILDAITRLTMEDGLLEQLSQEAVTRSISSWIDYGQRFIELLEETSNPLHQLGVIFYWVDHTSTYPKNSGIQRVTRGLAQALMEIGVKLVPVKWDEENRRFYYPSDDELRHLARWNGPKSSAWSPWIDPAQSTVNDWVLIPELTSYLQRTNLADVKQYASSHRLRIAGIFFDAIPFKMHGIYPNEASYAHEQYMRELNELDLIMPISQFSRLDLLSFLSATALRTPSLEDRIQSCVLPGEFLESDRITTIRRGTPRVIKILCVGTVEPRKNHLALLQAFSMIKAQTSRPIKLVIVGNETYPELANQVQQYINSIQDVQWEKFTDDRQLQNYYAECDFTVYPSLEEGFGLPILESLWYARPCICRSSGAMAEVAEGGGCLMVETADPNALAETMLRMIEDDTLRLKLAEEATGRSFKTWHEYAREVATRMALERYMPLPQPLPKPIPPSEFYDQFVNLQPRPTLSICISTYNRASWLSVSLKNLARLLPSPQADIEIVVCDNTSTDHTPSVVKPYLHRADFRYYRNPENVGMLGNLRVTAHHARGRYVWILGDDDLLKTGSIEKVLHVLQKNPGTALVYLNYAYTLQDDADTVSDLARFLKESTPIVTPGEDIIGSVKDICAQSENFFTAIYCLVFRRDHALRAYSQNTAGRPFSTMLTCIPTTYYTLNFMMNEPAYWVGEPQLVVNLNVSWMKYAPLWILERIPEVYDLAERLGAKPDSVDRWRKHTLPGIVHWFRKIYEDDPEGNMKYFSPSRLLSRIKHLEEFRESVSELRAVYEIAHTSEHPGAKFLPSRVFPHKDNNEQISRNQSLSN